MRTNDRATFVISAALVAAGCSEPPDSPAPPSPDPQSAKTPDSATTMPAIEVPADPSRVEVLHLTAPKPATWLWQPPRHDTRLANYVVPGRDGEDAAHLVISHLGPGLGGAAEANIERWVARFQREDGPVEPAVETLEVAGMPVTTVDVEGAWMKPGTSWHTPNQRLVAAIVETDEGQVFFQLAGPTGTVARNHEAFLALIRGLETTEEEKSGLAGSP